MGAKFVFIRPKSIHQWEALGVAYLAAYSYKYSGGGVILEKTMVFLMDILMKRK